jgi:protein phosphatase
MLEIEASVLTNVGRVRTNNEDFVSLIRPSRGNHLTSHGVLALVADGMGGHEGGELASRLAVDAIVRSYYGSTAPTSSALAEAIRNANCEVYRASRQNSALKGMGTTCVAVAMRDDQAWWAWIGDSRLYLLRSSQSYRMSEDHTVVRELIRRGLMTPEEAYNHPDRSVLDRAIGTKDRIEPTVSKEAIRLSPGDRLLLCSDGLHDLVTDEEIAELAGDKPVADSAESLMRLALARGGFDNVSIVLLEMRDETAAPKHPPSITREHIVE